MTEKTFPTETKSLSVEITKGKRDGQWIMGASARDRVDDTIAQSAWQEALNELNGKLIALWQHKSDQPFGFWENMKHEAGQLIGDLKIANTNLGKMIKQLLADGVPLGASIGFQPKSGQPNDMGGWHYDSISLLETSIVSVPANPKAQQIAKNFGIDLESTEEDPPVASDHNSDLAKEAVSKAKAAILAANQTVRKYS